MERLSSQLYVGMGLDGWDGMGWDGKDRMGWSSNIGCSLRAFSVLIRFFFRKVFESFGLS